VIYPPNYGHIIVNTTPDVLVTANWVANDFKRMYKEVSNYKGMAYYVVKGENGPEYVPNPAYANHPKVEILTNKFMSQFPVMQPGPMYLSGTNKPEILEFLTNPQKYAVELSSITS
jgi:glucose-6-phosphate isomerase